MWPISWPVMDSFLTVPPCFATEFPREGREQRSDLLGDSYIEFGHCVWLWFTPVGAVAEPLRDLKWTKVSLTLSRHLHRCDPSHCLNDTSGIRVSECHYLSDLGLQTMAFLEPATVD